jgi:hypothetical protein
MKPEDNAQNAGDCICPDCPTYNACMGGTDERLYCSRGMTECDPSAKSCICDRCPVWTENDLTSYYFCMDGAAQ